MFIAASKPGDNSVTYVCISLAEASAFRAILAHEGIDYQAGLGAGTVICVFIANSDNSRVLVAIQQWLAALKSISAVLDIG